MTSPEKDSEAPAEANAGRLTFCEQNRHYFEYRGRPIWLSGHSKLWPLTQWIPPAQGATDADESKEKVVPLSEPSEGRTYRDEVARVAESGGHLFRMTPFWPSHWQNGYPMPFKQLEPGRFDLSQWDEAYFEAYRDFFALAAERDIIIQLEIWDRPGLSGWHESRWPAHPMNPDHNVNYGADVLPTGSDLREGDIVFGKRLFYTTVRGERPELFALQQAYVQKLLDETKPFGNVIYCIENEGCGGIEWEAYWAKFIRDAVPDAVITGMPLDADEHSWRSYFDSPHFNCLDGGGTGLRYAMLDTVGGDASFKTTRERLRYDRIALVRETMAKYYLLMEAYPEKIRPVYVSNNFGKVLDCIWAMFCSGAAGLRYHRRVWDETEEVYRWVRAFSTFLDETGAAFVEMAPANHRLGGHGMCLANDKVAAVYLPTDLPVTLTIPDRVERVRCRLFDCDKGKWLSDETVRPEPAPGAGENLIITLQAPGDTGTTAYVETV